MIIWLRVIDVEKYPWILSDLLIWDATADADIESDFLAEANVQKQTHGQEKALAGVLLYGKAK